MEPSTTNYSGHTEITAAPLPRAPTTSFLGVFMLGDPLPDLGTPLPHLAAMSDPEFARASGIWRAIFKVGHDYPAFSEAVQAVSLAAYQLDQSGEALRQFHDVILNVNSRVFSRELLNTPSKGTERERTEQLTAEFKEKLENVDKLIDAIFPEDLGASESVLNIIFQMRALAVAALVNNAINYTSDPMLEVLKNTDVINRLGIEQDSSETPLTPDLALKKLVLNITETTDSIEQIINPEEVLNALKAKDPTFAVLSFYSELKRLGREARNAVPTVYEAKEATQSFVKPIVVLATFSGGEQANEPSNTYLILSTHGLEIARLFSDVHMGTTSYTSVLRIEDTIRNTWETGEWRFLSQERVSTPDLRDVAKYFGNVPETIGATLSEKCADIEAYASSRSNWLGERQLRLKSWINDTGFCKVSRMLLDCLNGDPGEVPTRDRATYHIVNCLSSSPLLNSQCEGMMVSLIYDAIDRGIRLEDARVGSAGEFIASDWFTKLPQCEIVPDFNKYFCLKDGSIALTDHGCEFIRKRLDPDIPYVNDRRDDTPEHAQERHERNLNRAW